MLSGLAGKTPRPQYQSGRSTASPEQYRAIGKHGVGGADLLFSKKLRETGISILRKDGYTYVDCVWLFFGQTCLREGHGHTGHSLDSGGYMNSSKFQAFAALCAAILLDVYGVEVEAGQRPAAVLRDTDETTWKALRAECGMAPKPLASWSYAVNTDGSIEVL